MPVFFFCFCFCFFFFRLFVCFVRFFAFRALRNSLSFSRSVRPSVCPPRLAIHLREVLSFRRGEDFGASDLASLFFVFLFFCFFIFFLFVLFCFFFKSLFFGFLVEESSGGICVLGSVRRTWGFALRFARSGGFRSTSDRGEMDSDQGKLFIGGISWETTEEKLRDYFKAYGEVTETVIMKDRATGRARGFGFVIFADPAVADRVVNEKHTIDGRTVSLSYLRRRFFRAGMRVGLNVMSDKGSRERLWCVLLWWDGSWDVACVWMWCNAGYVLGVITSLSLSFS